MTIRVADEKPKPPMTSAQIQTMISCRAFNAGKAAEQAMVSLPASESENARLRAAIDSMIVALGGVGATFQPVAGLVDEDDKPILGEMAILPRVEWNAIRDAELRLRSAVAS